MILNWWTFFLASILADCGIRMGWSFVGMIFAYVLHWTGACDCPEHE